MLENVPISAYLVCYGPLALTVIGFVIFAWMTDSNARRTYLRDLEGTKNEGVKFLNTIDSETPSGVEVSIVPDQDEETPQLKG